MKKKILEAIGMMIGGIVTATAMYAFVVLTILIFG
jgi:hypothetical protein